MEVKTRAAVNFLSKALRVHIHTNLHFEDSGISNRKFYCFLWAALEGPSLIISHSCFPKHSVLQTVLLKKSEQISFLLLFCSLLRFFNVTLVHTFFMFISLVKINLSILLFTLFSSPKFGAVNQWSLLINVVMFSSLAIVF